jgi:holo-[acyl-carrier protein] synthase
MTIIGIGVDVVDIERFAETLQRTPNLRVRLFTPDECRRTEASLAARFAAKEALAKAMGAPVGMSWHDAEVVTDQKGAPSFVLTGTVESRAARMGVRTVHLSLSHDAGIASAFVVLED